MLLGPCACSIINEDGQCIGDHSNVMAVREGPINQMFCEHVNFVCQCAWTGSKIPNKIDQPHLRIEDYEPDVFVLTECIPKA